MNKIISRILTNNINLEKKLILIIVFLIQHQIFFNLKVINYRHTKKYGIKKDNKKKKENNIKNKSNKKANMSENIKNSSILTNSNSINIENNNTNYISPKQFEKEEKKC